MFEHICKVPGNRALHTAGILGARTLSLCVLIKDK